MASEGAGREYMKVPLPITLAPVNDTTKSKVWIDAICNLDGERSKWRKPGRLDVIRCRLSVFLSELRSHDDSSAEGISAKMIGL
jgi:hypothetical protein